MSMSANDLEFLRRELGAFSVCVQAFDHKVATIDLRQGDRESLAAAVEHVEAMIDVELRKLLGKEQGRLVAKDLKETRVAALRERYRCLNGKPARKPARPLFALNRSP